MAAQEAFNVYGPQQPIRAEVPYLSLPGIQGGELRLVTGLPHIEVPGQRETRVERVSTELAGLIHLDDARLRVQRAQLGESAEAAAAPSEKASSLEKLTALHARLAAAGQASAEAFEPRLIGTPLFRPAEAQPVAKPETAKREPGRIRPATIDDIGRMVDADMKGFRDVYAKYDQTEEEMRAELTEKFTGRFNKVGGDWIQVYEGPDGEYGFMMCCPTNKTPEQFESWEQTTDNGTLETTYDPNGKNIYIVSLTMEGCGEAARNMIFVNQIGKMVEEGHENFFFETRLPGLKKWVQSECTELGLKFDELSPEAKQGFANRYFHSTKKNRKGKEVPLDPLVRIYSGVGCTFDKLVPDAYVDDPSMNFGAVGVFKNPLPKSMQGSKLATRTLGRTMRWLSRQPAFSKVAEKLF